MNHRSYLPYFVMSVFIILSCSEKSRIISPFPDKFAGIGIEIEKESDYARVVRVVPSSPAAKAGIVPDDVIIAIDNVNITRLTLPEIVDRIRGRPDSTVILTIESSKDKSINVISVKRKRSVLTDSGYLFEP